MNASNLPFWKQKSLSEMDKQEWEALCDGCGRCCLAKLQDEDTNEVFYTRVACRLLDLYLCRCVAYQDRKRLVPNCLTINPDLAAQLSWLTETCAYRRLAEGKDLDWWHPLVSGKPGSVHKAGISVRAWAVPENQIDPDTLEQYVIEDLK